VVLGTALLVASTAHLKFLEHTPLFENTTFLQYARKWPRGGAVAALLMLAFCAAALWRTAQATAIVRRGIDQVAKSQGMTALKSGPARAPLIAPSLLRMYGLRSAIIFAVMILALGASTFVLREAATVEVIGAKKGYAGDYGPALQAWIDTPGGIVVAPSGDVYFADSHNDVIRRIDARNSLITTVAGNNDLGTGFSGDDGLATDAQLDTPDGVAIAPDDDLIIADSHNDRVRRVDKPTGVITTIAGSGENGYDGDEKPATEAALNTPNAVAAASNGDIYIADTLNYRVRMIDHATGLIHTVAGDGSPGDNQPVGDGGPATAAHLNMPSDVALDPRTGDLYIADLYHNRVRRVDAKTHIISTVAGNGKWGNSGDDGPSTEAMLSGVAGIALMPEPDGGLTVFIADYYNGLVRAVGPDGVMRNLSDEGRVVFGAPTRLAFAAKRPAGAASAGKSVYWLYVADSSRDQINAVNIPNLTPNLVPPRPLGALAPAKKGG